MSKSRFNRIQVVFLMGLGIFLFTSIVYSSSPFETWKTCTQTWGESCNSATLDDAFDPCNGTREPQGTDWVWVEEVYINATNFFIESGINVTCQFQQFSGSNNYEYIWYYNTSHWINIQNFTNTTKSEPGSHNRSATFKLNSSEGEHRVRCIIKFISKVPDECADSGPGDFYDNDDVNFTVTAHLTYTSWNLTNSTTSETGSGGTYNRSQTINVTAHWNKNISYAVVEHNGTGAWTNYTISSYTENWTNYTLDLSNTTEFNSTVIGIRSIYANDTLSDSNNTSPLLYFSLPAGNLPNVTNFWFSYSGITTNKTNLYTNLTIHANVSDDVGLSTVIANITYPDGNSTNATMTGETSSSNEWKTWNYTFGNGNKLNQTGNYTVRIYARDIGGQEKASGIDYSLENLTFYVNDTYTLNLTSHNTSNTTYNRGEAIRIWVWDVNEISVETLNWTVNVTRFNQSQVVEYNQENGTYAFRANTTDPVGNYTIFANVSKQGNAGNGTWQFNISRTLYLNFSQPAENTPYGTNGIIDTPKVRVYNVRNETLNYTVNVTLQCPNGYFNLSLIGQDYYNTSAVCRASTSAGVTFQITANTSDVYNNSGGFSLDLTTQSSGNGGTTSGGGGGSMGGGGGNVTIINVTANVTDFNFTLSQTEIQIYRGEDGTIVGALSNIGTTNLTLSSSIFLNSTCCVITIDPSKFTLGVGGEEIPFTIKIHVNTTTEPDTEHFADIKLKTGTLVKSKRIKIIVEENPVISSLRQATGQISEAEEKISEYVKAGVDIGFLQDLLNKIKGKKTESTSALEGDDINRLKQYDDFIQSSLKQINDELNKLSFLKAIYENKWNITSGIVIGLISTYLATQVIIPYFRIEFEIRKLILERASLAKARVETTKSYFLRKIDERTFRSIITDKQGKIYKLKSTIDLKNEAKANLIRERLNPLYPVKLIKQKITKMRKKKKKAS